MSHLYTRPKEGSGYGLSILLGLICAGFIFLLVPITQLMQKPKKAVNPIEVMELAAPPPPPPLEEPPPPPADQEETPPPELQRPPPMPTLEQLELSINPGMGGDFSIDSHFDLNLSTESAEELIKLFGFDELDEIPRLIRQGSPNMQQSAEYQRLMRRAGRKQVVLLVTLSERGVISVQEVISATHNELIPAARQAAESSRFSPPMRNGIPVRARYTWPLTF